MRWLSDLYVPNSYQISNYCDGSFFSCAYLRTENVSREQSLSLSNLPLTIYSACGFDKAKIQSMYFMYRVEHTLSSGKFNVDMMTRWNPWIYLGSNLILK